MDTCTSTDQNHESAYDAQKWKDLPRVGAAVLTVALKQGVERGRGRRVQPLWPAHSLLLSPLTPYHHTPLGFSSSSSLQQTPAQLTFPQQAQHTFPLPHLIPCSRHRGRALLPQTWHPCRQQAQPTFPTPCSRRPTIRRPHPHGSHQPHCLSHCHQRRQLQVSLLDLSLLPQAAIGRGPQQPPHKGRAMLR